MTVTADFMSCLFVHVCVGGKAANLKISVWECFFSHLCHVSVWTLSRLRSLVERCQKGNMSCVFKMRHTVAISGLLQMWFMLNRASVAEVWQSAEENGIFFFLGRACRRCLIFTNWSLESSHMTRVKLFFFFLVSDCLPPLCLFSYAE